jgi:hypothetical protein
MIRKLKKWFFEWKNGHPFLLNEEAGIICEVRFDEKYKWMNDNQIKKLVEIRIKQMYKEKYPNAKQWSFNQFKNK